MPTKLRRTKKLKRRAKKKAKKRENEAEIRPFIKKYWVQRYDLFSKYDEGIQVDEHGWYSVTPEAIAVRKARRSGGGVVVVNGFCGVGGNAIQFDKLFNHVIAIDIDPQKVALVYSNAKGDPSYKAIQKFTLDLLKPKDGYSLFQAAQTIAPNIIMLLPRNVDIDQAAELSWLSSPLDVEIEEV